MTWHFLLISGEGKFLYLTRNKNGTGSTMKFIIFEKATKILGNLQTFLTLIINIKKFKTEGAEKKEKLERFYIKNRTQQFFVFVALCVR